MPIPNQLAELLQVENKDGAGGRKSRNSMEQRAREGAWLRGAYPQGDEVCVCLLPWTLMDSKGSECDPEKRRQFAAL